MSRYISFKKLKETYTLAEIFEFLQAGLQPLTDPSLSPIPCPEERNRCILNIAALHKLNEEGYEDSGYINQLIKKTEKMLAEDPSCESWKYFVPPEEEPDTTKVIFDDPLLNKLKTLIFSPQDREPAKEELAEVISILQNAIFEEKQLKEILKKKQPLTGQKQRKLRPDQRHKIECRKVAEKLWNENKDITIQDMIFSDEINNVFEGKSYSEKTIRNWINDLCPNRKPGRRPKK